MRWTRPVAAAATAAFTLASACTRPEESAAQPGSTTTIGRSMTVEPATTTSTAPTTVATTTTVPTTPTMPTTTAQLIVVTQACDIHVPYNHPVNQNCWMTEQEFVDARLAEIAVNLPEIMESPVDVEGPTLP
jgi:hypothetical protein